jgi:hypothetical protein
MSAGDFGIHYTVVMIGLIALLLTSAIVWALNDSRQAN